VRLHNVHDRIHAVLHVLDEPLLHFLRLIGVALDDYLVVAAYDRHGPWLLVPTFLSGCVLTTLGSPECGLFRTFRQSLHLDFSHLAA
jgi:hypothetical protein